MLGFHEHGILYNRQVVFRRTKSMSSSKPRNGTLNTVRPEDTAVHEWYRFVLSFPPHIVRDYLERFGIRPQQTVLDPFCGTGTTLVECKKLGIASVGIESNPMAHFASQVKVDWTPKPSELYEEARKTAERVLKTLIVDGIEDSPGLHRADHTGLRQLEPAAAELLLTDSISPLPLHKALVLKDLIGSPANDRYFGHEQLALAKTLVVHSSNLKFGPEVGVQAPKPDAPVIAPWLDEVGRMADDLNLFMHLADVQSVTHNADARQILSVLEPNSIDAVITSPPYPNEKDYTRTTRLESVLLGFLNNKAELRAIKKCLLRSNTRGVYQDDIDDDWVDEADYPQIHAIANAIEARRIELGKTSGFERLYARVSKLYFGGMTQHLADLRPILRPGARLAYVVGDQASYLRIPIRTGQLLADIAQSLGYELISVDLFRTRLATATKEQLREEVVVLRWPGKSKYAGASCKEPMETPKLESRYRALIEHIFLAHYREGVREFEFERDEIVQAAEKLGIKLPKNLGDLVYTFRYRANLPEAVQQRTPEGEAWLIQPAGRGRYRFALMTAVTNIVPTARMAETKIPDATPGIIDMYALTDEQSLLARLRYNRLIDTFTGVTCYSLQNHLRTYVQGMGQVETDEIYVGVDQRGVHYVFPVQAKGGTDRLSIVQIEQDFALCNNKFPNLVCHPIAAQFVEQDLIALFAFDQSDKGAVMSRERHYRLVPPVELTPEDLANYFNRTA